MKSYFVFALLSFAGSVSFAGGCDASVAKCSPVMTEELGGSQAASKRVRIDQVFRKNGGARHWFDGCTRLETSDFDPHRTQSTDSLKEMIDTAERGRLDWVIPATFAKQFLINEGGGRYGIRCRW